jgi:hypothetical protein
MDIVHQCLSLAPVPGLASSFSVLRFICSSVAQAQASKGQLQALTQTIAHLLSTLNKEYGTGQLLHAKTSMAVDDLEMFVTLTGAYSIGYLLVSFTQITQRDLGIRSEGGFMPIPEAPFHEKPKDFPDRALSRAYYDFSHCVSGQL